MYITNSRVQDHSPGRYHWLQALNQFRFFIVYYYSLESIVQKVLNPFNQGVTYIVLSDLVYQSSVRHCIKNAFMKSMQMAFICSPSSIILVQSSMMFKSWIYNSKTRRIDAFGIFFSVVLRFGFRYYDNQIPFFSRLLGNFLK